MDTTQLVERIDNFIILTDLILKRRCIVDKRNGSMSFQYFTHVSQPVILPTH